MVKDNAAMTSVAKAVSLFKQTEKTKNEDEDFNIMQVCWKHSAMRRC